MRRLVLPLAILCGLIFAASLGALLAYERPANVLTSANAAAPPHAADPLTPDERVADLRLPPFSATDQDGRPLSDADLKGRLTVVDFVFTHCPFICPMMTASMANLATRTADLPPSTVRFLSMSVDPEHDTPAALKAFAQGHGADTARWTFAHADADTVRAIVRDGLKFAVEADARTPIALPDGTTMSNIVHPPWFVLVGPDARVLGIYQSGDPSDVQALEVRLRAGAKRLRR
jgi:protein SCO1/2